MGCRSCGHKYNPRSLPQTASRVKLQKAVAAGQIAAKYRVQPTVIPAVATPIKRITK